MPTKRAPPPRRPRLTRARLEALLDEAIVDAYGDDEQRYAVASKVEDELEVPFDVMVLGERVTAERVELNEADDVVAVCRKGRFTQRVSVLDLALPRPRPAGWDWVEVWRYYCAGYPR